MKKFNLYENDIDKTWYDSSNVLYSECDDKDNDLKVVRITFSNGRTYQYTKVNVNDYLMFREASSQGSAFNTYMKKYECEKLENKDVAQLNEELYTLTHPIENVEPTKVKLNDYITIMNDSHETVMQEKITAEEKHLLEMVFFHLNIKYSE